MASNDLVNLLWASFLPLSVLLFVAALVGFYAWQLHTELNARLERLKALAADVRCARERRRRGPLGPKAREPARGSRAQNQCRHVAGPAGGGNPRTGLRCRS